MLETSSWGECGNDDLPGDQAPFDKESLYFDSDPLAEDFDSFGFPEVALTLSVDRPIASLAIRLNEVSPNTGASHLVTYRFFNLAYRGGDAAEPQPVEPGVPFSIRVPLNVMGHTFKPGWRIRLAVSPSFYPTLWEPPEAVTLTVENARLPGQRADPAWPRAAQRRQACAAAAAGKVGGRIRQSRRLSADAGRGAPGRDHAQSRSRDHQRQARHADAESLR